MQIHSNFLLRIAASAVGVLFLRDGYTALRGREMWIQKGLGVVAVFRGWRTRMMGLLLLLFGLGLLVLAWVGTRHGV